MPALRKPRPGRFGPIFGAVVHEAIGLVLRDPGLTVVAAVRTAAARLGLTEHLEDAAADVTRALETLRAAGLVILPGPELQLEYPVAGALTTGRLLAGYIRATAWAREDAYPQYVAQVSAYARLIEGAGVAAPDQVCCGLLFAADGQIRWLGRGRGGRRHEVRVPGPRPADPVLRPPELPGRLAAASV